MLKFSFLLSLILFFSISVLGITGELVSTSNSFSLDHGVDSITLQNYNQTWLEFDGVNDYIDQGEDITLNGEVSFGGFFKRNQTGVVHYYGHKILSNDGFYLADWSNDLIRWRVGNGSTTITINPTTEPSLNEWVFIVGTANDTTTSLYINGQLNNSAVLSGGYSDSVGRDFFIGSDNNHNNNLNGSIDFVFISNTSLKDYQIEELYERNLLGDNLGIGVPSVYLHYVGSDSNPNSINSSLFDSYLNYLNQTGYETITYENYLNWREGTFAMPEKPIIIGFDLDHSGVATDGSLSVYTNASVLMDKYGYIGVLNIQTDEVSENSWSISWNQIQELVNDGWGIASHSVTHCNHMDTCNTTTEWINEMNNSRNQIFGNLSIYPKVYVYPQNDRNTTSDEYCRLSGYEICMGTAVNIQPTITTTWFQYKETNLSGNNLMRRMTIQPSSPLSAFISAINPEEGLLVKYSLNENNSTTAYDSSGNSNNGIISGATWNNDGVLVTLTEGVDYTLTYLYTTTTVTLIDHLYEYLTYSYEQFESGDSFICSVAGPITSAYNAALIAILAFMSIAGTIVGVLWFWKYANPLVDDVGRTQLIR